MIKLVEGSLRAERCVRSNGADCGARDRGGHSAHVYDTASAAAIDTLSAARKQVRRACKLPAVCRVGAISSMEVFGVR